MDPIDLSAKLNTMAGPVHACIYFTPEPTEEPGPTAEPAG